MARINNQYLSPYEVTIARLFPAIDQWLYPAEAEMARKADYWDNFHRHFSTRQITLNKSWSEPDDSIISFKWLKNIAGGFTPIAYMWKDLKDTFKPYKADYQRKRDWLQPINGLGNVLRGILSVPLALIAVISNTLMSIQYLYRGLRNPNNHPVVKLGLIMLLPPWSIFYTAATLAAHLLDSTLSIVRGLTQIATFPLTWVFRIPLRHFILTPKDEQTGELIQQNIEDSPGIKKMARLLKEHHANIGTFGRNYPSSNLDQPEIYETHYMFKFKVLKALHKGQPTAAFNDIEKQQLTEIKYFEKLNGKNTNEFYNYVSDKMHLG